MKKIITNIELRKLPELGRVVTITPLSGGIVNRTFQITTNASKKFIIQNINSSFDPRIIRDYQQIEINLRKTEYPLPRIIDFWEDEDGLWKITEYIEHNPIISINRTTARSTAIHLGHIHTVLKNLTYIPSFSIPGFHDSHSIIQKLEILIKGRTDLEFYDIAQRIVVTSSNLNIPDKPRQLIHGDPKFNNFLFDFDGDVIALIDWDTCMVGHPLIDVGDMLRSLCKDQRGLFDNEIFETAADAYRSATYNEYSKFEMVEAMKLITLELSARFLIDWFEDRYFNWNPRFFKNRKESNLSNARRYVAYADSMF